MEISALLMGLCKQLDWKMLWGIPLSSLNQLTLLMQVAAEGTIVHHSRQVRGQENKIQEAGL